jgi:hypothetical protein
VRAHSVPTRAHRHTVVISNVVGSRQTNMKRLYSGVKMRGGARVWPGKRWQPAKNPRHGRAKAERNLAILAIFLRAAITESSKPLAALQAALVGRHRPPRWHSARERLQSAQKRLAASWATERCACGGAGGVQRMKVHANETRRSAKRGVPSVRRTLQGARGKSQRSRRKKQRVKRMTNAFMSAYEL